MPFATKDVPAQRYLSINFASTVAPMHLTVNGREYVTAPAVLIVEGVLNQAYIKADEFVPALWQGIPVVCNHPMDVNGTPISARDPDVLARCGMGYLYHTRIGQGQRQRHSVQTLQAEIWLDVAQIQALGNDALQALRRIEAQELTEISTGFFADSVMQTGSAYGDPFTEILTNILPDHLALLPNSIGACSVAHGCGTPRLQHQACTCHREEARMEQEPRRGWRGFVAMLKEFITREEAEPALVTEMTNDDIREALYSALAREMDVDVTPFFIDSIDSTAQTFTYRRGERLQQRGWTTDDTGVLTLLPEVQEVQRSTTHLPVGDPHPVEPLEPMLMGYAQQEQEEPMPPTAVLKRRIDALIANQNTRWTELDRERLEALDEAFLIRLEQQPVDQPTDVTPPQTVQEAIATLPAHLHEPMAAMAQEYEVRKHAALAKLMANASCPFSQEELQAMTAQRLEQLVAMATPTMDPTSSYLGMGLPHIRTIPEEERPPEPPNTFAKVVELQRARGVLH